MNLSAYIEPELGKVSRYIEVPELIVRSVPSYGVTADFDGGLYDSDCEDEFDSGTRYEHRLQGRLINTGRHKLSDILYDLSYYSASGSFLGLNRSRFLDEDELDVDDHLPIDMKVEVPDSTSRCVFNVRAKRPGWIGKLFWG